MQQWVLSRCYLRCILYTDPAVHAAYNSKVEAVRLSAASASTMRLALWRASMSSCHGTARLLTPSPPTMCYTVVRIASSCLGTARLLTTSASTMSHAVARVACS